MAVFAATPVASGNAAVNLAPLTVAATAEQAPGQNCLVTLVSDQVMTITFGSAGNVPTPSAVAGLRLPANVFFSFDTGVQSPSFKLFNTSGSTANVSYQVFSKF